MIVYKYLVPERVDVLQHSKIRFTQPLALNDPFEAMPCFEEYQEGLLQRYLKRPDFAAAIEQLDIGALPTSEAAKEWARQLLANDPASFIDFKRKLLRMVLDVTSDFTLEDEHKTIVSRHFAFLSLSRRRDSPLMWSHYGASHHGFVIGFDAEHAFFKGGGRMGRDGLRKVEYSEERYVIPRAGLEFCSAEEAERSNTAFFFTKSVDWAYEEELRMMAHPDGADVTFQGEDGIPIHLFEFPPDCVKEVIFGFKMADKHIEAIIDLVKVKYKHISLLRATPDKRKFEMRILPHYPKLKSSDILRLREMFPESI